VIIKFNQSLPSDAHLARSLVVDIVWLVVLGAEGNNVDVVLVNKLTRDTREGGIRNNLINSMIHDWYINLISAVGIYQVNIGA